MATIVIRDRPLDIDVRAEVEKYEWKNAVWTDTKLIASSPFRYDNTPSFFLTFEGEYAGVFGDSAYDDDYYKAGNIVKLLAFLRKETEDETVSYLMSKYDYEYSDSDIELIKPSIQIEKRYQPLELEEIEYDKSYLQSRGIPDRIVRLQNVFDKGNAIGICWYNTNGQLSAIKYRNKNSKEFWYEKGSTPIKDLVYGLDKVYERGIKRVAICEGEIDAMTWQAAGIYGIAIGGARLNERQKELIINSGIDEMILSGDNDTAGQRFNDLVYRSFKDSFDLFRLDYSEFEGSKDVNDLGVERLKKLTLHKVDSKTICI